MTVSPLVGRLGRSLVTAAKHRNDFLDAALYRRPPRSRWTTPNRVIFECDAYRLRQFAQPRGLKRAGAAMPVLIVPPEVNRSFIVDFAEGQSLVAKLSSSEGASSRVHVVDWRSPITREVARRDIDDSVATILDCLDRVGGKAHLIGICQGGWESAIAAALSPEQVVTLTLVAAPIDFKAGEGMIKHVASSLPMSMYRSLVALGGGVMRGELISAGFDGFLPFERFFLKYLALWNHLHEARWMARYHLLNDWYRAPKDLPGPLYLRAVRELFKENRLVQGRLLCLGRRVDLKRIACPLCLVAGRKDHITPSPQLWAARDAVSSVDVLQIETAGGHIGTFMGRRELREDWAVVSRWLRDRDPLASP